MPIPFLKKGLKKKKDFEKEISDSYYVHTYLITYLVIKLLVLRYSGKESLLLNTPIHTLLSYFV